MSAIPAGSWLLILILSLAAIGLVVLPVTESIITSRRKRMSRTYMLTLNTTPQSGVDSDLLPLTKKLREKYPEVIECMKAPGWFYWAFATFLYMVSFGYINWLSEWVYKVSIERKGWSDTPSDTLKFETYWSFDTRYNDSEIKRLDKLPDCFPQVLEMLEERALRNAGLRAQSLALLSDAAHNPDLAGALSLPTPSPQQRNAQTQGTRVPA